MVNRSGQGWLTTVGARVLQRLMENSLIFHYGRIPGYWGTMSRLAAALDVHEGERLLDVGCGTGIAAGLARGMYVGIDTDLAHLRFAQSRAQQPLCSFIGMSALDLGFADGAFDKAVLINMVHHLDEVVLDRLLRQLKRVVSKQVFVLDTSPEHANRLGRFFLDHDRGEHIRERTQLRALLERHYEVEKEEIFPNTLRTISQVLFTMRPKTPALS